MRIHTYLEIDIETGKIIKEEGFEYEGPVALCGSGGTTVTAAPQSDEELEQLSIQNDLLKQQLEQNETSQAQSEDLTPVYMEALGMTQDADGNWIEQTDEQKLESMSALDRTKYEAEMAAYGMDVYGNKLSSEDILAAMTPSEAAAYEAEMASYGLDAAGNELTEEQLYDNMSELEKLDYDVTKLSTERYKSALEETLEIDPLLEQQLADEMTELQTTMAMKLGPDWMLSTPGQKAMVALQQSQDIVRDEASRGEITAGEERFQNSLTSALGEDSITTSDWQSTLAGLTGTITDASISDLAAASQDTDLSSAYNLSNSILSAYSSYGDEQTAASMQSAANSSAAASGSYQLLGSVAGSAMMAAAIF